MTDTPHNPGSHNLPLPPGVPDNVPLFGGTGDCYRYRLRSTWCSNKRTVLFVMMNPSTACATRDDRTIAKCRRYAKAWGYSSMWIGNTFAYRCTDQSRLTETANPVGPDNDGHLLAMARKAELVVMAYGKPKTATLHSRGSEVARLLEEVKPVHLLRLSKCGAYPWHPLYLPKHIRSVEWRVGVTKAKPRVMVCGGHDFVNRSSIFSELDTLHQALKFSHVITGTARGADTLAAEWAQDRGIPLTEYPTDGERYHLSAGILRNQQMLVAGLPDLVVAFPGGRGTRDMVDQATVAGVEVREISIPVASPS